MRARRMTDAAEVIFHQLAACIFFYKQLYIFFTERQRKDII